MRTWLALLLLTLCWARPAAADAPATEAEPSGLESTMQSVDSAFQRFIVDPLDYVMFFDVWFWDNTVDAELGTELGGEIVAEVREDGQVGWASITKVKQPTVEIQEPRDTQLGQLKVTLRPTPDGVVAEVPPQPVDLAALGIEPFEGEPAEGEVVQVVTDQLAPFKIRVDRSTGQTVASRIRVQPEELKPRLGDTIRTPEGRLARVVALGSDGSARAESKELRYSSASIPNPGDISIPVVVAWLVFGALFFTLRMMFVNIRMLPHAFAVTTGRYDSPEAEGEISHFQALSSALSATVGLGNIAGVAIAVSVGGPGAVVWMVVAGFLGMSSKFVECTLGQMYRTTRPDGSVSGGPMHYLDEGLAERGMGPLGKVLATVFAVMCIGGSFGGGNMFQANQSNAAVFGVLADAGIVSEASSAYVSLGYGFVLMFLVGLVIIGGIQRIGAAAGLIVPFMCGVYVLAGLFILVWNASEVPAAFGTMLSGAFTFEAGFGGFMGTLIQGFRRAAFSNEAGVGSASIAHSAATTKWPVREGIVALLEPFIDTIIVCTMTGLVVVVTGTYLTDVGDGVVMTQAAFGSVISWFPILLSVAVVLFAFSTMISWSYYGERCSVWLFGDGAKLPYRIVFLFFVFLGANLNLGSVLTFSDLMILGMAFPNILGALFLVSKVKAALDDYTERLNKGEFQVQAASRS